MYKSAKLFNYKLSKLKGRRKYSIKFWYISKKLIKDNVVYFMMFTKIGLIIKALLI